MSWVGKYMARQASIDMGQMSHIPNISLNSLVVKQKARRLHGVAGRVQDFDFDIAQGEDLTIGGQCSKPVHDVAPVALAKSKWHKSAYRFKNVAMVTPSCLACSSKGLSHVGDHNSRRDAVRQTSGINLLLHRLGVLILQKVPLELRGFNDKSVLKSDNQFVISDTSHRHVKNSGQKKSPTLLRGFGRMMGLEPTTSRNHNPAL